jgi:hypothetical protein
MLVVIEHTQQAQVFFGKRLGQGHGIDRPVDDKHDAPDSFRHLLAVGHNDVRHMDVGRIIATKIACPVSSWALTACEPAMIRPSIVILPLCMERRLQ